MGISGFFMLLAIIAGFLNAAFMVKTHAISELKASLGRKELCHFYTDTGRHIVKALKNEAGIIQDSEMGSFMINPRNKYIDGKLNVPVHILDSNFGASMDVSAARLAETLGDIAKDKSELAILKATIANGDLDEDVSIKCLSSNIKVGLLKEMMTVLAPHQISNLVQMQVQNRLKNNIKNNNGQMILAFLIGAGVVAIPMILMKILS
jgi:hypothetical protein